MMAGSAAPAVFAAGGDAVSAARALIGATLDRVFDDVRQLARGR